MLITQAREQDNEAPLKFPHIVTNEEGINDLETCLSWLKKGKAGFEAALAETGAVLFRGFPVHTPQDFDGFIAAFDYKNFPYRESLSNALRKNITDRVFTANEAPPEVDIYLHHELAQTPLYPSKLFFFCEIAPDKGGATPLCRSDILLEKLAEAQPAFIKYCAEKGLKYTNIFAGESDENSGQGRSWRSLLGADDRAAAETRLSELGYSREWLPGDCLKITSPVLPAVKTLDDGRRVFFNQLIAAFRGWKDTRNDPSKAVTFGDGTSLPPEGMQAAIEISDSLSYDLEWQPGDVALVDNLLAMHGRRAFSGKRRVLASLIL